MSDAQPPGVTGPPAPAPTAAGVRAADATTLRRRLLAEAVGTALLVAAVIGSGIAAQRLSPGEPGLQLLENALATGAVLTVLILVLQPVSAAFNPVITVLERLDGLLGTRHCLASIAAQVAGAAAGAVLANLMFAEPAVSVATAVRTGPGLWLAEVVATAGLVLTVTALARTGRAQHTSWAVGLYITGAYWFTSSTSFANPAVTLARTLSDTFAGIAPTSVPAFLLSQAAGAALGHLTARTLYPRSTDLPGSGADNEKEKP